jgi:regulator of sigma E protease
MKVYEFCLGMGPVLLKKQGKSETVYSIRAIPFGGAVMLGEDDTDDENAADPDCFRNKPVWQRMIVILAGVFMNLILGFIVCVISVAMSRQIVTTTIHGFRDYAVSNSSLAANDKIVAVNGMKVFTSNDIVYQIFNTSSKMTADENTAAFDFTVIRGGKKIKLTNVIFNARKNEEGGKSVYLDFYVYGEKKNVFNVIAEGAKLTASRARLILISLADIVRGTYGINDFSGPVGVVNEIGKAAADKSEPLSVRADELLGITSLITLNVAVFNILPFPALDGARFIFFIIEAIRRKPANPKIESIVHFSGFALLMLFMLAVTFNDIRKLVFK